MIVVVGCGNANRSDDGVGPEVVRALKDRGAGRRPEQVRLIDAGTDGMAAMFVARGCRSLIIVETCMIFAGIMRCMLGEKSFARTFPPTSPSCSSRRRRLRSGSACRLSYRPPRRASLNASKG
jgi:Ni,Fe-hydrogenase maturation factor